MEPHILEQLDPKVLGARLQEARKARGLTQQNVADELQMARTTIVAIEKGERRVSSQELVRFADLYGRPVSDFVARQVVTVGFVPQFRTEWREDVNKNEGLATAGEELQRLAEDYVELERLCGLPTKRAYTPTYETALTLPEQTAEESGATGRHRL